MASNPEIRSASPDDFDAAVALLSRAGLPVADLDAGSLGSFLVASIDDSIAGLVGFERYGSIGLLRFAARAWGALLSRRSSRRRLTRACGNCGC
jgi:hypothetical protein